MLLDFVKIIEFRGHCSNTKTKKTEHPQPERDHPDIEVSPKLPCGTDPSQDVPANNKTRRMAQEIKKLRSLHILHVPPRKSKTR